MLLQGILTWESYTLYFYQAIDLCVGPGPNPRPQNHKCCSILRMTLKLNSSNNIALIVRLRLSLKGAHLLKLWGQAWETTPTSAPPWLGLRWDNFKDMLPPDARKWHSQASNMLLKLSYFYRSCILNTSNNFFARNYHNIENRPILI